MSFEWKTYLTEDAKAAGITAEIGDEEYVDGENWATALVFVPQPNTLHISADGNKKEITVNTSGDFSPIYEAIADKSPGHYSAVRTYVEELSPRQLLQAVFEDPIILEMQVNTGRGMSLEDILQRLVTLRFAEKLGCPWGGKK